MAPEVGLCDGEHFIGRGAECSVELLHEAVSRKHAELIVSEGGCAIVDLGSRHGTRLNGVRLEARSKARLSTGDVLTIPPWSFRVEVVGEPHRTPHARGGTGGTYATRQTIFLRLGDSSEEMRELGWNEFSERYRPVIIGFARNAGLSMGDAEDVFQDVLLGFFRVSGAFEYDPSRGRFRGYLKRATLNVIRKRLRKTGSRAAVCADAFEDDAPVAETMWDAQWAEGIFERAVEEVRGSFDPRTFEAFELYTLRRMPAEAVAERLGLSVNSVHQAKSRVLKSVEKIVERVRAEEG